MLTNQHALVLPFVLEFRHLCLQIIYKEAKTVVKRLPWITLDYRLPWITLDYLGLDLQREQSRAEH